MDRHCVICGKGPAVKSHLLPRAAAHAIRGGAPSLKQGSIHHDGFDLSQSGGFDWFLCKEHEARLAHTTTVACDSPAILPPQAPISAGKLVKFAASVVWRYHHSTLPEAEPVNVGAWEPRLRSLIYEGDAADEPTLLIARYRPHAVRMDGLAIPPSQGKFEGRRVWAFTMFGAIFMVKLDGQPWPEWAEYVAVNGKDFVRVVWRDFDRDLPEIRQITSRFTHASRWNKPGQKPRVGGSPRSPRRSA